MKNKIIILLVCSLLLSTLGVAQKIKKPIEYAVTWEGAPGALFLANSDYRFSQALSIEFSQMTNENTRAGLRIHTGIGLNSFAGNYYSHGVEAFSRKHFYQKDRWAIYGEWGLIGSVTWFENENNLNNNPNVFINVGFKGGAGFEYKLGEKVSLDVKVNIANLAYTRQVNNQGASNSYIHMTGPNRNPFSIGIRF